MKLFSGWVGASLGMLAVGLVGRPLASQCIASKVKVDANGGQGYTLWRNVVDSVGHTSSQTAAFAEARKLWLADTSKFIHVFASFSAVVGGCPVVVPPPIIEPPPPPPAPPPVPPAAVYTHELTGLIPSHADSLVNLSVGYSGPDAWQLTWLVTHTLAGVKPARDSGRGNGNAAWKRPLGKALDTVTLTAPGAAALILVDQIGPPPVVAGPPPPPGVPPPPPVIVPAAVVTVPAQHPYFLATIARRATWAKEKADNHWVYQYAVSACNRTGTAGEWYYDIGASCAWLWQVSRDSAALKRALAKVPYGADVPSSPNAVREYFIDYALLIDWLWDGMSAGQQEYALLFLNSWARWSLGKEGRGGFRFGDSDQTNGQYFGLALTDLLQRRIPGAPRWLDSATVQGIPVGGLNRVDNVFNRELTARNAVGWYAWMARGGVWNESSEYNQGTMKLLVQGVDAINTATGKDWFPEFTSLFEDVADFNARSYAPSFAQAVEWGDLEHPHDVGSRKYDIITLSMMLEGVTPNAPTSRRFLDDFWKVYPRTTDPVYPALEVNGWRALPFYDPFVAPAAQSAFGAWLAEGRGLLTVRNATSLFYAEGQNGTGEDHGVWYHSNVTLFRDGEYILDHPRGYNMIGWQAIATNGPSYGGAGMVVDKQFVRADSGAGWWSITSKTGGSAWWGWDAPPAFLSFGQRTTLYTQIDGADVVVTWDTLSPPNAKCTRADRYANINSALQGQCAQWGDEGFAAIWHAMQPPIGSGDAYSWTTPGGQAVRLSAFGNSVTSVTLSDATAISGLAAWTLGTQIRIRTPGATLYSVVVAGRGTLPTVTQSGKSVRVGSKTITITGSGVTVTP